MWGRGSTLVCHFRAVTGSGGIVLLRLVFCGATVVARKSARSPLRPLHILWVPASCGRWERPMESLGAGGVRTPRSFGHAPFSSRRAAAGSTCGRDAPGSGWTPRAASCGARSTAGGRIDPILDIVPLPDSEPPLYVGTSAAVTSCGLSRLQNLISIKIDRSMEQ